MIKGISLLAASTVLLAAPASADIVCEWVDFAQAIQSAAAPPSTSPRSPEQERAQTRVALAMFEALNAIDRRYETYLGLEIGNSSASQDAAAATAAYEVLMAQFPSQKTALSESYQITLETVRDPAARDAGVAIGKLAAALALKAGGIDPAAMQLPYLPRTQPGVWVPTQLPVIEPWFTAFKPWILERADSIRPGPPPPLSSERWAKDYDEIRRLGGKESKERTAHQTLMARYRITPHLMPAYRQVADAPGRSSVQNARMFAMLAIINDDAILAVSDAKLHYDFWRPITAVRNGDKDGNDATAADAAWEPLIATPNHPEYPCAHCITASATAEFMKQESQDSPPSGVRVATQSIRLAAVQSLPSWDAWVKEVSFSRTLGGVHYRFSNEVGEEMGRKVARLAMAKAMRPLPRTADGKSR
ncbi:vanadium-dependent haloperoxidase [Sphingomonas sp. NSE70-1]|uniref:Vanadium-dependent haloperoxidase n=1 Tax=Sphingomonas caseinilyticus TaxID=2908205 RepID=A0ABT0RSH9_9SPHN|nr:vanadium-dependent haloperoxidase [Sphingomonas caseinilyticus]MCL6697881.1 vanadium-dependent haloperoxidase [Sphingomonas caseinilyticus]